MLGLLQPNHKTLDVENAPPVSINNLSVCYQRKSVLRNVNLCLPEGKLIALLGPNGAGKSTLIKSVLNLIPRIAGDVRIYGRSGEIQNRLVGYVPQQKRCEWNIPASAVDVVAMGFDERLKLGRARPVARQYYEKAINKLRQVGMAAYAHRRISRLSGGQRQRVFIARALARNARIYFMDEPFAGVDLFTEKAIMALLRELKASGKTCVVAHHDLKSVPACYDYVILLNTRVVAAGPTEKIFTEENLSKTYGGRLPHLNGLKII